MYLNSRWMVTVCVVALAWSAAGAAQQGSPAPAVSPSGIATTVVPREIRFSGLLKDGNGSPLSGSLTVTFSLYEFPEGGSPLWSETQEVNADGQGRYAAMLGATSPDGLPLYLFASGQARWLGVQPQIPGMGELPRVLLVSAPYALKAGDADTLGGRPASEYVTTDRANLTNAAGTPAGAAGANPFGTRPAPGGSNSAAAQGAPSSTITGGGTTNYIPLWTSSTNIGNSVMFQSGTSVGVGTTTPSTVFTVNKGSTGGAGIDVAGSNDTRVKIGVGEPTVWSWSNGWTTPGDFSLVEEGKSGYRMYAKPGGNIGINNSSPGFRLVVDKGATAGDGIAINGTNDTRMRIGVGEPTVWSWANGWKTPGDLSLIEEGKSGSRIYVKPGGDVGIGTATPAALLEVNGTTKFDQAVTFASGQTFPGAGTVTSVGSGAGLTGGPITGSGTLSIATGGVTNAMLANPSLTVAAGTDLTGGGPVSLGGMVALSLDTTQVPQLNAPNVFNANQTVNGNLTLTGSINGGFTVLANNTSPDIVGGYSGNLSLSGLVGATISGGGAPGEVNTVNGNYVTIGGGLQNTAEGSVSTVCGGQNNIASGQGAVVGGGVDNMATGEHAVVMGGLNGTASGQDAIAAGGQDNVASGPFGAVLGGQFNVAQGLGSFAAGSNAHAATDGSFVWGDNSPGFNVSSTAPNQFVVRATGGTYIYSNSALTSGVMLAAGGASWSSLSDRNAKFDFAPVDGPSLLRRIAQLPITRWSYRSQTASIRHLGPMAQDFHAAFGVGEDDKHITAIDSEGVALAGIQELYRRSLQKDATIRALRNELAQARRARDARLEAQDAEIHKLRERVDRLEALDHQVAVLAARLGATAPNEARR